MDSPDPVSFPLPEIKIEIDVAVEEPLSSWSQQDDTQGQAEVKEETVSLEEKVKEEDEVKDEDETEEGEVEEDDMVEKEDKVEENTSSENGETEAKRKRYNTRNQSPFVMIKTMHTDKGGMKHDTRNQSPFVMIKTVPASKDETERDSHNQSPFIMIKTVPGDKGDTEGNAQNHSNQSPFVMIKTFPAHIAKDDKTKEIASSAVRRLTERHFLEPMTRNGKKLQLMCHVCHARVSKKRGASRKERAKAKLTSFQCEQCKQPLCVHPCMKLFHTRLDYSQ